jgi:hypothetical protein
MEESVDPSVATLRRQVLEMRAELEAGLYDSDPAQLAVALKRQLVAETIEPIYTRIVADVARGTPVRAGDARLMERLGREPGRLSLLDRRDRGLQSPRSARS